VSQKINFTTTRYQKIVVQRVRLQFLTFPAVTIGNESEQTTAYVTLARVFTPLTSKAARCCEAAQRLFFSSYSYTPP